MLAIISKSVSESILKYFNSELHPTVSSEFSPLYVFDKLDEKSSIAGYCQQVKEGTIPVEIIHHSPAERKRMLIRNIKESDEPLLQKIWRLSENEMLLGFNYRNRCFWTVYNT